MKLSNYLVLLVALVFLGGMTGCGKGNSSSGGDSASTQIPTNNTPIANSTFSSIVADIEAGRFTAALYPDSVFTYAKYDSGSTSTSRGFFDFDIKCYGFNASWCDDSGTSGGTSFNRKLNGSGNLLARSSHDTQLTTNLISLRAQLGSLVRTAIARDAQWKDSYGQPRDGVGYVGTVPGFSKNLVIRVGDGDIYNVYYIDLNYPLAANPIRVEKWKRERNYSHKLQSYYNYLGEN